MKSIRIAAVILGGLLCVPSAAQQPADGPFGFIAGSDISKYAGCTPREGSSTQYRCVSVPKPHDDMELYTVTYTPETGICRVYAASRTVTDSVFGERTRDLANELIQQISSSYGPPERYDFLRRGSIWKEPQDWMMALLKEERSFSAFWTKKMKNRVRGISLDARALKTDAGWVGLSFEFDNYDACEAIEKKRKASSF